MVQLGPDYLRVDIEAEAPRSTAAAGAALRLENALFWGLLLVLAVMPLPFGSARPWAWSLAAVAVGLLLLTYALGVAFTEARPAVPMRRLRLPLLLLGIPVIWIFVQMAPIGASDLSHPLWGAAAEVLGRPTAQKISVDPHASGSAMMRLFLYCGIFFLAVQLCRTADRAYLALNAAVAIGAAYALYGLAALLLMPEQLVWVPRTSDRGDLSQTVLSRNAYATFAGLSLIAAIALFAKLVHRPAAASGTRRAMLASLARVIGTKAWAPAAALLALGVAVLLSHSRAGLIATGLGAVVLLCCMLIVTRLSRLGRFALAALVVGGMLLTVHLASEASLDAEPGGTAAEGQQRTALYALVRQAISDSPLLGHGYGTFESAFPGYRDSTLQGYFPNAQNDYLELAFELGLPAASLLLLAIAAVGVRCLVGVFRRRRDIVYPALAVAASTLAGAQALVDFSLQVPATAALFSFLLGLGFSQAWTSSDA
jgi:O-antigen ligase